jgi:hypothetical protein
MVPIGTIVPKHSNSKGKNRHSKQQAAQAKQPKTHNKIINIALTSLVPIGTSVPRANPAYNYTMQATKKVATNKIAQARQSKGRAQLGTRPTQPVRDKEKCYPLCARQQPWTVGGG